MVKMELLYCKHIKFLPPLGRLPSLKELRIRGLSRVEEVGSECYWIDSSFPYLESLEIQDMLEWKRWSWGNALNEDSVGRFHKLRKLIIRYCPNLVGKLPSFLPSLEEFQISVCEQLIDLPGKLPSLKRLYIGQCQGAVLRNMTIVPCLTELIIERIEGLLTLDESCLKAMAALQKLYISNCNELKCLWGDGTDLDYLTSLKHLDISSCKELVSLVNVGGGILPLNLEYLNLSYCKRLKEVPNGLNCLKSLDIVECPSLEVLQLTNGLDSLENLDIRNCLSLKVLQLRNGGLHSLKSFVIVDCPSLEVLCDSEMSSLETFEVQGCKSVICSPKGKFDDSLKFLTIGEGAKQLLEPFHSGFSHLTNLSIGGCFELETFPEREFPIIPTLVSLSILRCKRLKSLTDHLQSFHRLQSLSIVDCDEFECLPERGLPNLVSFTIDSCPKLRSLPIQMQNLTSLQCLNIRRTEISSLEGCLPPKLSELEISDCKKLSQPMAATGLNRLTFLKKLTIRSNADMVSFPDNDGLLIPSSLAYLEISGFKNVKCISRGIQTLISLQQLCIAHCPKLKSFPVEGLPPALEYLLISDCPHLQDWCSKDKGEYGPIISYKN